MRLTGVDLSLRSTGVALADDTFVTLKPPSSLTGYDRHWYVADILLGFLNESATDLVVLEDYAPHSPGINATITLAEIGGIVRSMLTRHRLPFVAVKPNVLKHYACGKGNASKAAVFDAALEHFTHVPDVEHRPANYDEADAYWLRSMATVHYCGGTGMERAGVLNGIDWPVLEVVS